MGFQTILDTKYLFTHILIIIYLLALIRNCVVIPEYPYIINVSRVGLNHINVHEYRTVCITSPGDFNVTLATKNAIYLLGLQNM